LHSFICGIRGQVKVLSSGINTFHPMLFILTVIKCFSSSNLGELDSGSYAPAAKLGKLTSVNDIKLQMDYYP
jgi:hypothetical protein